MKPNEFIANKGRTSHRKKRENDGRPAEEIAAERISMWKSDPAVRDVSKMRFYQSRFGARTSMLDLEGLGLERVPESIRDLSAVICSVGWSGSCVAVSPIMMYPPLTLAKLVMSLASSRLAWLPFVAKWYGCSLASRCSLSRSPMSRSKALSVMSCARLASEWDIVGFLRSGDW
jgi:hypothetical protein